MARFDVFRTADDALVLDCQSDFLAHLQTRIVAPLLPPTLEPKIADRLNPAFEIDGDRYVLFPQFMAAVPEANLLHRVTSLSQHDLTIVAAIDMLLTGF